MASSGNPQEWVNEDTRRMLHAVYRVGDMDKYISYMQECFGMKLLRYRDIKEDKYINAFLGYGSEKTNFALEYVAYSCPLYPNEYNSVHSKERD